MLMVMLPGQALLAVANRQWGLEFSLPPPSRWRSFLSWMICDPYPRGCAWGFR